MVSYITNHNTYSFIILGNMSTKYGTYLVDLKVLGSLANCALFSTNV